MYVWKKWQNPVVLSVVAVMLAVSAYAVFATASDLNDASDAQVQIGALSKAASDIELAWYQAMGADALAATGEAADEAQGFYDGAINLYNSAKVVLSAAGIEQIDHAMAGSDQGLAAMNVAFAETARLASLGQVEAATDNHLNNNVAIYGNVDAAIDGLGLVAAAADERLAARMNGGAADLRMLGWISSFVVALGAAFAGWTAWSIYKREDETDEVSAEPSSFERAA